MRFLHNLFTALWIGGLLTMVLAVLPGIRKNEKICGGKTWLIIEGIQARLRPIAWVSMAGLAITGILLGRSSKEFTGLFNFGTPYMTAISVKHILIILMVVLAFVRLSINKRIQAEQKPELQKASFGVLLLNAVLGVVVLFLSSVV
jgi:putative copper export protein